MLALALAAIGLYGAMSNNVTGRTNEIGIRMSLGAQPGGDIPKLVLCEILILIGIGLNTRMPPACSRRAGGPVICLYYRPCPAYSANLLLVTCCYQEARTTDRPEALSSQPCG